MNAIKLFYTIILIIISFQLNAQSTYWYGNGVADSWYVKTDIFAFKCIGG